MRSDRRVNGCAKRIISPPCFPLKVFDHTRTLATLHAILPPRLDSDAEPKSDQYYVLRGQDTEGPLAKEALFSMRRDGLISDETLICRVDDSQWTPMGVLFPSTKQATPPPPPPPPPSPVVPGDPPLSGQRSQEDRELLREYLIAIIRIQEEAFVQRTFKDALADAIPALGAFFGRRKAVIAGTTVTDADKENAKRESLFQLRRFLDVSATYLEAAPWITFLTARKHATSTKCYAIATGAFADFGDKKLVDETSRLADALGAKASALMDSDTSANIRELIRMALT